MAKVGLIKALLFCFLLSPAYGQKIKYKEIWGLLSTKQYESAEPFLKRYLKDNTDNPNAYLYMGIIFQEKSAKDDVLKQTTRMVANMDSAIFFYDKAYKAITEKNVKHNDEYYAMYNRRDLRTGEFGVKLSDIQFDLEKKMEGLRERIDRVKMVKYYFSLADTLYKRTNELYKSIQVQYPGVNELYLRSTENTLTSLTGLSLRYDSMMKAFDNYKASSSNLGKTGYNQTLNSNDIENFKRDGLSPANFYENDVMIWNYKKFAESSKEIIAKEIIPMREHLVTYDIEINKLREKVSRDSLSVNSDLTKLIDKLLTQQLEKFDKTPLPISIFNLKIADLQYRSTALENKVFKDSTNVNLKLNLANKESHYLNRLDSIAGKLQGTDIDSKILNYEDFITNTYSNTIVLKSYIKALKEYAERERRRLDEELSLTLESLRWLVNAPDSIPLFLESSRSAFKPLVIVSEKFTAGLHYNDSVSMDGYFYSITPSRVSDIKITFPVDKPAFKISKLKDTKCITFSDAKGQIFFVMIYSTKASKENKYAATLAKVYRSDGLAWSNNYMLNFIPTEITFKQETGELTIKDTTQQNVVDKNGKLIR
jgi:hypothetical protein